MALARAQLEGAGLAVGTVTNLGPEPPAKCAPPPLPLHEVTVVMQNPSAGTVVTAGTPVNLTFACDD